MENKFKNGDVVVCVNAVLSNLTFNKEYKIASYNNTLDGVYLVNDTGIESFYCSTRFVLKKQPTPTKEAILSEAKKRPEVKQALKRLFPEMFKCEKEYFDFGEVFEISAGANSTDHPIGIAQRLAPEGMESKCLFLTKGWDVEIIENEGRKLIVPFRK